MASFVCDFTIRAYSVDFDHTFSRQKRIHRGVKKRVTPESRSRTSKSRSKPNVGIANTLSHDCLLQI